LGQTRSPAKKQPPLTLRCRSPPVVVPRCVVCQHQSPAHAQLHPSARIVVSWRRGAGVGGAGASSTCRQAGQPSCNHTPSSPSQPGPPKPLTAQLAQCNAAGHELSNRLGDAGGCWSTLQHHATASDPPCALLGLSHAQRDAQRTACTYCRHWRRGPCAVPMLADNIARLPLPRRAAPTALAPPLPVQLQDGQKAAS
jgi:hypothetical protein